VNDYIKQCGHHHMDVDLAQLDPEVDTLLFTLSAWDRLSTLSSYKRPTVSVQHVRCRDDEDDDGSLSACRFCVKYQSAYSAAAAAAVLLLLVLLLKFPHSN
jgi:hypothetical protein